MADYWKSQAKKFCDFCKCWIADNKPSVEFHEKGKRHKDNVTQRLKQISRQSLKDHKAKLKIDEDMKNMEKAALQAYMKDVESNADYTSQLLNKKLNDERKKLSDSAAQVEEEESSEDELEDEKTEAKVSQLWYEAISDEGYTYYWNTNTGESVWEPPTAGYVSLGEQKKLEELELKKAKKLEDKEMKTKEQQLKREKEEEVRRKTEEEKLKAEEERAYLEREKMRSRAVKEDPEPPRTFFGPAPRGNPYGSWTAIKPKKQEPVDLQLPETKQIAYKVPEVTPCEPEIKFKEKNLGTIQVEGNDSFFKKRKTGCSSKRNMRQRLDDD